VHPLLQSSGESIFFAAGDVVALRHGSIDIIVSGQRCQCFGPSIFTDLGIDVASKRVIVVKSFQHFYSAFVPLAAEIVYMTAAGSIPPDPRNLSFKKLQTTMMYPWIECPHEEE
jgi:microcystin degradation protein MlrC